MSAQTLPVTQRMARLVPQLPDSPSPPQEVVHISAFAIMRDKSVGEKKILLAKRLRPPFTAGKWTLPSSIIDYGENPEEAVKRIVEVQLGKRPEKAKLVQVQSYGDKHWDLCFVYEVDLESLGTLSQDLEKAEYFATSNLPAELRQDHREVLEAAGLIKS
jgi:ADP-ribose pyrophosphatase YjhB (NUDIX family)